MYDTISHLECRSPDLNWGPLDFQSSALPTELPRQLQRHILAQVLSLVKIRTVQAIPVLRSGALGLHSDQVRR